jgi:hypothetical protein
MEAENPYNAPAAALADPAEISVTLYKPMATGLATFFGSPLAGAYVLTYNLKQLGRARETANVWLIAVGLFAACTLLAFMLPESVPGLPFTIVQLLVMSWLSKRYIAGELARHQEKDGAFYSNWRAFGIAVLFVLAILAVMVPVILIFEG